MAFSAARCFPFAAFLNYQMNHFVEVRTAYQVGDEGWVRVLNN
jgi:hypothetical protein